MKIHKGDTVLIISGKDRGKKGKVLAVLPKAGKILVEGINFKKKHQRPRKQGEKGQIIEKLAPLFASSVKLVCPKCGQGTRVGHQFFEKKKSRICRKCGQEI